MREDRDSDNRLTDSEDTTVDTVDTVDMADTADDDKGMYLVGIGASAGGVEALQTLFRHIPEDAGMAYVVVQHLSPDYKSYMSTLLSRCTNMPVVQAEDGMVIEPNRVYLNIPSCNLQVNNNRFVVTPFEKTQTVHLPIDILFRSIASAYGKNAISIVLSGSGSDGSLGIRSVKEEGGMIMAQDSLTAQFVSMPHNSIATGFVDYILPPEDMGEELVGYIKHPYIKEHKLLQEIANDRSASDAFAKVISVLREHTGIDFSLYKESTILRRIERRVSINRCESVSDYYTKLCASDDEKITLCKDMLIGVTSFFRDKDAFLSLEKYVLPAFNYSGGELRIWSVACSTGEEVYSLAILINEFMEKMHINGTYKIFATDIEQSSIDIASRGTYSENIMTDVPQEFLNKYFIRRGELYQVKDSIRNNIVFATHNVLSDPAFSKLDLLVCRNLFIYLKSDLQQTLLETFYYALNPSGFMFMGSSESVGEMSEAFTTVDTKWKIYSVKSGYNFAANSLPRTPLKLSAYKVSARDNSFADSYYKKAKLDRLVERAIENLIPPSVLLDSNDNIIHIVSSINRYIDLKTGKFTSNLLSNLPNDLSLFVSSLLRRLRRGGEDLVEEKISGLKSFEGQNITITGKRLEYNGADYYMISFDASEESIANPSARVIDANQLVGQRVEDLEKELQASKESLHATVEELETSNEELQSTNEELIASNEELQSTNEELQSVNEELYTVNAEYQAKIEELTSMTEDMDNLLVNAEIGALYLDGKLCIRKATPIVKRASNITEGDIGRQISQITFMSNYPEFLQDVQGVVDILQNVYRYVTDHHEKIWLIRIQPYRTEQHLVDGVLLTMVDTTYINKIKE